MTKALPVVSHACPSCALLQQRAISSDKGIEKKKKKNEISTQEARAATRGPLLIQRTGARADKDGEGSVESRFRERLRVTIVRGYRTTALLTVLLTRTGRVRSTQTLHKRPAVQALSNSCRAVPSRALSLSPFLLSQSYGTLVQLFGTMKCRSVGRKAAHCFKGSPAAKRETGASPIRSNATPKKQSV